MPDVGGWIGDQLGSAASALFDGYLMAIWAGVLTIFEAAFQGADQLSTFEVSTTNGPLGSVWPTMLWVSGLVALGLFFVQLTSAALNGGTGFFRLITGPAQYGIALAMTVTLVSLLLAGVDGLTAGILHAGLGTTNFYDAMHGTGLLDVHSDVAKPIVLALIALFAFFPAAIGFLLEMLFRHAAVVTLLAAVPIAAAGMTARVSGSWYWRTLRWLIAAVLLKPTLALVLVLGFATFGGADTVTELLLGAGILMIALWCPFVLFRLLAFVDPDTDAGAAFRQWSADRGLPTSYPSGGPNLGKHLPQFDDASSGQGAGGEESSGDEHSGRFDTAATAAAAATPEGAVAATAVGAAQNSGSSQGSGNNQQQGSGQASASPSSSGSGSAPAEGQGESPAANHGSVVAGAGWRGTTASTGSGDGGTPTGSAGTDSDNGARPPEPPPAAPPDPGPAPPPDPPPTSPAEPPPRPSDVTTSSNDAGTNTGQAGNDGNGKGGL